MAELLDAIEIETAPAPMASVIWLHGLGADGGDFVPIVEELDLPAVPIRFVFPHAPMQPVTINGGHVMRAWYDIVSADLVRREDGNGVRASGRNIEALIAREKARGSVASRIVLAGFSQGGAIALHIGLRHAERLAGVMALSTYLPLADTLADERSAANQDISILMAHGRQDPIVALGRASGSRDTLSTLGYSVEWHEYPMPHSVCAAEIADIGAWLRRVLAV
jgi:phospholipase/carboxylesterase